MHHTPGPWTVSTRQWRAIVLDDDRNEVCEAHAAAALIAAVPELIELARQVVLAADQGEGNIPADIVNGARAAINKATPKTA